MASRVASSIACRVGMALHAIKPYRHGEQGRLIAPCAPMLFHLGEVRMPIVHPHRILEHEALAHLMACNRVMAIG